MTSHARSLLSALLLHLGLAPAALALPLYDAPDAAQSPDTCKPMLSTGNGVWDEYGQYIDERVHVYLSADFAAEYSLGTGNALTQNQARQALFDAMEVWNRESRGPVFVYEGETQVGLLNNDKLTSSCFGWWELGAPDGGPIELPAVLVSSWSDTGTSLGGVWTLHNSSDQDCTIHGRSGSVGLNVQRPALDLLEPVLIHELGHALGLDHSFGDGAAAGAPMSVMQYPSGVSDYTAATGENVGNGTDRQGWRNHLWPWDIDCAEDELDPAAAWPEDARARQVVPRWRTYRPSINHWGSVAAAGWTWTHKAASVAGGLDLASESGIVYPVLAVEPDFWAPSLLWADASIQSGFSADGVLDLDEDGAFVDAVEVMDAAIAPLLWTPYEGDWSALDDAVMAWPEVPRAGGVTHTDIAVADPPTFSVITSEHLGQTSAATTLHSCPTTGSCSLFTTEPVASHVALRASWNPQLAGTVYATVATRDCDRDATMRSGGTLYARTADGSPDRCGGIRLHPGEGPAFVAGTVLAAPKTLVAQPTADPAAVHIGLPTYTPPGGGLPYEYSGSTDVAPGVACAPLDYGVGGGANCIVAWVDAGTPDHHVLVAHFSTDGTDILFHGDAYPLQPSAIRLHDASGTETGTLPSDVVTSASDLSAAYVDGRFWIALKSTLAGHEQTVSVVHSAYRNLDSWDAQRVFVDDRTVDAPSLVFDPLDDQAELGLVWTTLD